MKLGIVVGHTDKEKGAGMTAFPYIQEYEFNTLLAAYIEIFAEKMTFETNIFFRDNRGIELTYKEVARWGADVSVELHFNSFNGTANGCLTLHGEFPEANLFAHLVHTEIQKVMEHRDRGIKLVTKKGRGGRNVNSAPIPQILVEPFFGSNLQDSKKALLSMQELAKAILRGSAKYFSL